MQNAAASIATQCSRKVKNSRRDYRQNTIVTERGISPLWLVEPLTCVNARGFHALVDGTRSAGRVPHRCGCPRAARGVAGKEQLRTRARARETKRQPQVEKRKKTAVGIPESAPRKTLDVPAAGEVGPTRRVTTSIRRRTPNVSAGYALGEALHATQRTAVQRLGRDEHARRQDAAGRRGDRAPAARHQQHADERHLRLRRPALERRLRDDPRRGIQHFVPGRGPQRARRVARARAPAPAEARGAAGEPRTYRRAARRASGEHGWSRRLRRVRQKLEESLRDVRSGAERRA